MRIMHETFILPKMLLKYNNVEYIQLNLFRQKLQQIVFHIRRNKEVLKYWLTIFNK